MNPAQEYLQNMTRRHFFQRGSNVLGGAALASLLGGNAARGAEATAGSGHLPVLHHAPKAKHVIYLHMEEVKNVFRF